ncbi:ATP-binding protein [Leptolyngbya ohadii]|uniref:ATP-binding protein n=1 Tax=Leptolyngbya ohadii TaxID=1962290 RepID=UPI000B59C5D0|nr:ATP-binding protein [Leptolyngbya ohadii]
MTALPPLDRSLYELAQSASPTPALQLSPTTFKSMVGLLLDFLLEQKTAATIWVKLPRGKVWQAELERFCQTAQLPHQIYLLQNEADWLEDSADKDPRIRLEPGSIAKAVQEMDWTGDLMDVTVIGTPVSKAESEKNSGKAKVSPFPLVPETQLKREYFLLVAAQNFYGLLLAHRPRSSRSTSQDNLGLGAGNPDEEALERKHPLLTLYSFDAALLKPVLAGINQAIAWKETACSPEFPCLNWEELQAKGMAQHLDPLLLAQLLTKQVQRQEDLWRSGAIERQRAKQAAELQQENQELLTTLQQKNDFVQNLGQELRTPLATMKTALSLLNSPSLKPPQRQKYMEMLSRECDRQNSLISSGLSLLQLENAAELPPSEPLRLSEIVPGVVSTYQPLAEEKGLRLAYTIPEDLPAVDCPHNGLRQIVINLLHNSIKFTPRGGQVWVRAKQQSEQIHIEFRDTGIGIAPSELPKIFDRFYRGRQSGDDSGVGLGLTIVQQLVNRSRGSINVKSKPGEGTVFVVVLPVRSGKASKVAGQAGQGEGE